MKAEDLKQLFSKIRYLRNNRRRAGVTRIEIPSHPDEDPKTCTEWTQIDVPTEIVYHLQQRNQHHFGQAHSTPFTVPPLSTDLGFRGNGLASLDILQGQYDTTEFEPSVRLLIRHLKIMDEMVQAPGRPTITDDEFVGKLKV